MTTALITVGGPPFLLLSGAPNSGGLLYFFVPGTSTPQTVYKDKALTLAHTHPIILDSAGWPPGNAIWAGVSVDLDIRTSADVSLYTVDDINPQASPAGTLARLTVGGRLSIHNGVPFDASRGQNSVVRYVPFSGGFVGIYNTISQDWDLVEISSAPLSIAGLTNNMLFDVFAYNNGGVVALEGVSWSTDSIRAIALTTNNDILVKTGDLSRRYLGTCRKRGGLVYDDNNRVEVWNYYNQIPRHVYVTDATNTWAIAASSVWRQANASAANQIDFCIGTDANVIIEAHAMGRAINSGASNRLVGSGIGIDSTSFNSGTINIIGTCSNAVYAMPRSALVGIGGGTIDAGQHYLAWLERGDGTDTQTFDGDGGLSADDLSTGLFATLMA